LKCQDIILNILDTKLNFQVFMVNVQGIICILNLQDIKLIFRVNYVEFSR